MEPAELDPVVLDRLTVVLRGAGLIGGARLRSRLMYGGWSNLTYEIFSGQKLWVLRRPPAGHLLATAHDVGREYRVVSALAAPRSVVPVPTALLLCEDDTVMGSPFYVTEKVEGDVIRSSHQALSLPPAEQVSVADHLMDVLADLHSVDPDRVGLGRFGRPAGFMDRQVSRWTRQLHESRTRPLVGVDELAASLASSVPPSRGAAIVHGDFRLDNCIVRAGRVQAVLDWEMSTLDDPMSDLGLFVLYYEGLADIDNPVVESPGGSGSFPRADVRLDRYARRTTRDLSDLTWYVAFAWCKFAVMLEGIHHCSAANPAEGSHFEGVADLVQPSVDRSLAALRTAGAA